MRDELIEIMAEARAKATVEHIQQGIDDFAVINKAAANAALDALIERLMDPDEGMLNAAMFDAGPVGCCAHTEETATETWQFMLSTLKPKGKTDE